MKRICIKNITADGRIGSVFFDLFRIVHELDYGADIELDFSGIESLHPFFVASLAVLCDSSGGRTMVLSTGRDLDAYLKLVSFSHPKQISCAEDIEDLIKDYGLKNYTPVCKFRVDSKDRECIESGLQHLIEIQAKVTGGIKTPLSYLFSELITNIVEHSQSSFGYIFSQYLPEEGCVDK